MDKRDMAVKRLQDNLAPIRKIAGWTTQDLGDRIGVTKQTISNLENSKSTMTYPQYMAICAVLDDELENNKENTILPQVIDILLNKSDELSEVDFNNVKNAIAVVSTSAAKGTKGKDLTSLFITTLSSIGFAALLGACISPIGIAATVPLLLKRALRNDNDKQNKRKP